MARRPKPIVVRFDVSNPRAERRMREVAGRQITRIVEDTRVAAREAIARGFKSGDGPMTIALDLAGRVSKATGRREGGILGMTSPQAEAASNFYDRITSGDPTQMRAAMDMKLRDRRFDSTIEKAIDEGTSVTAEEALRMYERYVDNAVELRGEMVSRTETGQAVMAANHEAVVQGLEKTGYTSEAVTRIWRTAGDGKVRDSHAEMEGQEVSGLDEPFVTGNGAQLMFPLDDSLGAPAEDIINCRCDVEINVDFARGVDLSED